MNWIMLVLTGATINVLNNLGYKNMGGKESFLMLAGMVMACAAATLIGYSLYAKSFRLEDATTGNMPFIIVGMGIGSALVLFFFVSALAKGPLSIVDPLWACTYALVSVAIGMVLLREAPSTAALAGIGLYLAGAIMMARG